MKLVLTTRCYWSPMAGTMRKLSSSQTLQATHLVQLKAGMAYPLSFACFNSFITSSPVMTPGGTSHFVTILNLE